jgi:simple sugar transport system permease protein
VWWLRARTTWGHYLRAVGRNAEAARTLGINVDRARIYVMAVAGALAGLAATSFVLGHIHAYQEGVTRGVGFLGISAALLGRSHPAGIVVTSLLLGFLSQGGLAVGDLVPKELTEMLQGVVVLAVAAAGPWVRRRRS